MAMYEELTGETLKDDDIAKNIAETVSKVTGKKMKPEDLKHFKPRNKTRDN